MTRPAAKGWCPTTRRPMMSGDGLLVRVKPAYSRLDAQALTFLADLSDQFGNGVLDLTSRANLQIRGVSEQAYPALLSSLQTAGLAGANLKADQLNLTLAPFTGKNSLGWRCADYLYAAADDLPELPAKFGFSVDCGEKRYLTNASADLFIEAASGGGVLLRCAGSTDGLVTDEDNLLTSVRTILDWYLGLQAGAPDTPPVRMRKLLEAHDPPYRATGHLPHAPEHQLAVGPAAGPHIIAAPYGQLTAGDLRQLAAANSSVQITTGRMMIVETLPGPDSHLITTSEDKRLSVAVCPGAPHCPSASVRTRDLADSLVRTGAWSGGKTLHISGCAKGCAAPEARDICIVGRDGRFDIVEKGCAWQAPSSTGILTTDILERVSELGS